MLGPVLLLLGMVLLFRALPASTKQRVTSTPVLAGAIAVLVLAGLLTVILRGAFDEHPTHAGPVPVDERGVCAQTAVHPRCTALLLAASGVLQALDAAPEITVPGSGRLIVHATVLRAQPLASVRLAVGDAFRAAGWTPVGSHGPLTTYERDTFSAAVSLEPSGEQTQVTVSFSE